MNFGIRQKEAREAAEMTQMDFGFEINMSRSAVAMIETGKRKMPRDVMGKAVQVIDDGFYTMAAAEEVIGHVWVPKLDGKYVDLHRCSVSMKTEEEIHEALTAIKGICVSNHPASMPDTQRQELKAALLQVIDAIVALSTYVAVICREYRLSWIQLWREHRVKLKSKGYVK